MSRHLTSKRRLLVGRGEQTDEGAGSRAILRVKTLLGDVPTEITACAQVDDGIQVLRYPNFLGDPLATQVFTDSAKLELGGCATTDDGAFILVAGTVVRADGVRPWAAKVARQSLVVQWARTFEADLGVRLEAVAPAASGVERKRRARPPSRFSKGSRAT